MIFYRFTKDAVRVMSRANQAAYSRNQKRIGTEHILQGLVEEESGKAFEILTTLNIFIDNVIPAIDKLTQTSSVIKPPKWFMLPQTQRARKLVMNAITESRNYKPRIVGTEHLLLGLLNIPDSTAVQVLESIGFSIERIRQQVTKKPGTTTHLR
jgi:ATP-dependent Clp protease ATP-binding subunit ClpC